MRIIALLLVLTGWMQAIDLVVDTDFTTNEDTALVISYADLMNKCTVSNGTAVGFKISSLGGDGALKIANSATGPWDTTPVATTTIFVSGQYLQYVSTTNLNGTDVTMLSVRARDSIGNESAPARAVNVDITPVDDPITASSHEFVQPAAPVGVDPDLRIREDNLNTWTWQQLKDTLQINDVENQPWTLRIISKGGGTLTDANNVDIVLGADLTFTALANVAVKWQPPANVYTKVGAPAEPALVAFTAQARTTSGDPSISSVVTLTTPVLGVADPVLTPTATTLGAIAPLVVTRGTTTSFTYEALHALCSGTNDVDRVGTLSFYFNGSGVNGCSVNYFNSSGVFIYQRSLASNLVINMSEGSLIQIVVPDSLPIGGASAGSGTIYVSGSAITTTWVPLSLDVRAAPSGGGTGTVGGEDSGGSSGCGAGAAGLGILLLGLVLPLRRRSRNL